MSDSPDLSRLKHKNDEVVLTFFVARDKEGGGWYALNRDLDLGGIGDTGQEAVESALDTAFQYLSHAYHSGHWDEMVPRPMPLKVRAKWHLLCLPTTLLPFLKEKECTEEKRQKPYQEFQRLVESTA